MFWLILLIVVAALCALVLFLVAPAAGRKELRTPFAGRNFAHRGYFGKDQRPPENSLPAFAAAVQNGYGMEMDVQFSSGCSWCFCQDGRYPGRGVCTGHSGPVLRY